MAGDRLPEATTTYPAEWLEIAFSKQVRELRVQVIRGILWCRGSKTEPVAAVLVRDPAGQWRDEALVATDPSASAALIIAGYGRRRSVELAFFDSKQFLGLHDPRVRAERSVERAPPMAWFVGSLTILRYCAEGIRARTSSRTARGTPRRSRRCSRTCSGRYGCRCGSTRFMGSPVRMYPHRNVSNACSTRCQLWLEGPKV
ncbi:MAG: hypothetical protein IRY99_23515 [Isosphaeraceae bacterium]|nr:hypothetical protein [Isosphaeraceae bacterium]